MQTRPDLLALAVMRICPTLAAGIAFLGSSFSVMAQISEVKDASGDTYLVIEAPVDGSATTNYSEPGPFGGGDTGQPDSWNGDRRWGNDGAGTSASWDFTEVPDGTYDVYASWRNNPQANVSLARYTGTDGFEEITLDHRLGAAGFTGITLSDGARDINFAALGMVTLADGEFTLTVDDSVTGAGDASTFIFADAVALGPLVILDADEDGLPDVFEDEFGLDKNDPNDADDDGDADGLSNLEEYENGTDPTDDDSDSDGLSDGDEVNVRGTDPNDDDSDDDDLKDGVETGTGVFVDADDTGSDPNLADSDGDGINDGDEVVNGTDPNRPNHQQVTDGEGNTYLVIDNGIDTTGDGMVDEGTFGYTEGGTLFAGQDIATVMNDSWDGDRRWGNDGADTTASWTFEGLSSGAYSVYASWKNGPQANVSTARYAVSDDGPEVELDQSLGASGHPGILLNDGLNEVNFALLGEAEIVDGTLEVVVDDSVTSLDPDTFIFADAVAIGPINNLGPIGGLLITDIAYDAATDSVTLTWSSIPSATYAVVYSSDMVDWSGDLEDSIPADEGQSTTRTFDLGEAELGGQGSLYFRVEIRE